MANIVHKFFLCYTLYHTYSKVGRGKAVLRPNVPHLSLKYRGIACPVAQLKSAPWYQSEEIQIVIELTTVALQSHVFAPVLKRSDERI